MMNGRKEVVIIGGGILGASTAYHLARSGVAVTLVDRQHEGQATAAAAGIICPWVSQRRNQAWYQLARNGAAYYKQLIAMLEIDEEGDTGYERVGAIYLHTEENKIGQMIERAEKRKQEAKEIGTIQHLSIKETKKLFPLLETHFQSVYISGAARVDGKALRNALLGGAEKYGARIIRGNASLIVGPNKVLGVSVNQHKHMADLVVVTAGAWAAKILEPLGIPLQIKGQKAQLIHVEIKEETGNWPVIMPANNQYMLPLQGGKIVLGTTYEDEATNIEPTIGGMHEIINKAIDIAPPLKNAIFKGVKVGFRPVTPNFMPIIGNVPHIEGLLLANGLGASGLTIGPYLGKELANIAMDMPAEIDLSLYDVQQIIEK